MIFYALLLCSRSLRCIACDFKFTKEPLDGHFCTVTSNNEITLWQTDRPHCVLSCTLKNTCHYINHNPDTSQCILGFDQCETLVPMVGGTVSVFGPPRDTCLLWGSANEPGREQVNLPIRAGRAFIGDALVVGKVEPNGHFWGNNEGVQVGKFDNDIEILTMDPACSVPWIPYVAGELLPAGVVNGGRLSDGSITYICRINHYGILVIGNYNAGTKLAYYANAGPLTTTTMEILVLL